MDVMPTDHLQHHYALLLGLGEEWAVTGVDLDMAGKQLHIHVAYRKKSAICPRCGVLAGLHDSQPERTWRHLDTMQFETLIHARTPRVDCPEHGVQVIELPWAAKHSRFTLLFEAFSLSVIRAAKTVKDAQTLLRLNWHQVEGIMAAGVRRGLERRGHGEEISFVGMDEKSFLHGRQSEAFACVMTDLDSSRVLEVTRGRSEEGARDLVEKALTPWQREMVCGVAVDMSAPFGKAIRETMPNADVVYDKFHVEKHLNEAVDDTRKQEHARLAKKRDRRLAHTKHLWLKGLEHLSPEEEVRRKDLLRESLQTGKAWGLKEMFGCFWRSRDKHFARANFEYWHKQVLASKIRPMVKVAQMLKKHLGGLLAWFDSRIDNGLTEGYNSAIQALKAAARGYRNFENFRTAVLFHCGKLDMMPDLVRVGGVVAP